MQKEHSLQTECVNYFRLAYPQYAYMLINVPNGAKRSRYEIRMAKQEGLTAGAPDLLLLVPRQGYGHLGIEMKKPGGGIQSARQKIWQQESEKNNNAYSIVHSFDEFRTLIASYLQEENPSDVDAARKELNLILNK